MARSFLTLIAAIAVASFFAEPAVGQFTLPRITLPKFPKKVTPPPTTTTTTSPDTDKSTSTSTSASNSSSHRSDDEVRGKPIPGAKITFSNNPDGSNPKTSFGSSEFVYGHLDLGGKTIYDAFGLKNLGDAKFYYIHYAVSVWQPGEEARGWDGPFNATLVSRDDAQKTYWNFDVLPEPTRASNLKSAIEDELPYYREVAGLYGKVSKSTFPKSETYTVDITLYGIAVDDWGKRSHENKDYPTVSATFGFQFSLSDAQTLVANAKKAQQSIDAAKTRQETLHAIPDWWAKGAVPPEPKLTPARLVPMIKNYIGQWNLTYLKHMIYPFKGPVWAIEKNDLGIPRYRRMTSAIYIIYRDPKETSCQLGYLEMHEPYAGGGTYSEAVLSGISDVKPIDCAAVK